MKRSVNMLSALVIVFSVGCSESSTSNTASKTQTVAQEGVKTPPVQKKQTSMLAPPKVSPPTRVPPKASRPKPPQAAPSNVATQSNLVKLAPLPKKPPPAKPKWPQGKPLIQGAPPFDHVALGRAIKIRKLKAKRYVAKPKQGDYLVRTRRACSLENGKLSYGTLTPKVFYTEKVIKTAVGSISMVAEAVRNPNQPDRMVTKGKFLYQLSKKGPHKGSYMAIGKPNLAKPGPRMLKNPEHLLTPQEKRYPAENNRYTITVKPVARQTIRVYGKTYKNALKMERSWTQVFGKTKVKALEISWWARGVGQVAKLARFGDNTESTWTIELLKDRGHTPNPHSLTRYLKAMNQKQVKEFNAKSAMIDRQLARKKPSLPITSALLGAPERVVVNKLMGTYAMRPMGKPRTDQIRVGKNILLPVRQHNYRCTRKAGCIYSGMGLITNLQTGKIMSMQAPVSGSVVRKAGEFFERVAGRRHAFAMKTWLKRSFRYKKASKRFGDATVMLYKTKSGQWMINVSNM